MIYILRSTLIFLIFVSHQAWGQRGNKKQIEAARIFLNLVLKGQTQATWELFDKKNSPQLSKEGYEAAIKQLTSDLSIYDTCELTMSGIKFAADKKLNFYTFRAISKTNNIVDEISVDVLFVDSSELIAGVQPKKLIKENSASTTKGKETEIEKGFTASIEGVSYHITGINIVHFANNEGLLAIQVEYKLPENITQESVKKEAVKFAKYLVSNGYVEKAKTKAAEIKRTLLEAIGVSFLDAGKKGGYNVMLNPDEFK